ncbi:MAG: hypothetical protein ACHQAY_13345 [Hyphomicrobiales bacterium]
MSDIALPGSSTPHRILRGLAVALAAAVLALGAAFAWPHVVGAALEVPKLDRLFAELHRDPVLLEALREQNAALADKDEAWALAQDRIWNAERIEGGGPLQRSYMERPASQYLRDVVTRSDGLVTHAFLIDAKGRMAAAPFLSFNFWQFDKPKFHYTFARGAGARDVSWLQLSWDGSHPVCWRAETMVDPRTGAPIGVLALEVNYLEVGYFGCREEPVHTPGERATNHVEL